MSVCEDGIVSNLVASLYDLPVLSYDTAWRFQKALVEQAMERADSNALLLLEHEPVFTLGRTTQLAHYGSHVDFLRQKGFPVQSIERGGSVTYHGPGQIVGYPILRLRNFCSGPKTYMHMLEEVIIRVLAEWGIEGRRVENYVGVWVKTPIDSHGQSAKIASMGVRIERGITMHGFALNVTTDLKPFEYIVPCGIEGCRVTSMAKELFESPDLEIVRGRLVHHFAQVFGLEWEEVIREIPANAHSLLQSG